MFTSDRLRCASPTPLTRAEVERAALASLTTSTFMRPSHSGFCDAQAGQYNLTATSDNKQTIGRPPAGVSVTNANHIHFERNIFTQMGATGLDFISGTHDDMVVGNVVTEIAGNGVSIDEQTSGYTISHNAMVNAPSGVAQNQAGTNTITDTPAANPQSVISTAGIEAAYADIKNLTIPTPSF